MRLTDVRWENAMKRSLIVILSLLLVSTSAYAAESSPKREQLRITRVLQGLSTAWQNGDRNSWANAFAEDAYFTVRFAFDGKGGERVAWGHQLIFDNFHSDTVFDISVTQIRFVRPDVADVELSGFVVKAGVDVSTDTYLVPKAVLERKGTQWKVVAIQNTPFVVNEFRAYGNLRRFKVMSAENSVQP